MKRIPTTKVKRPKPGDFIAIPSCSGGYYFGRELNNHVTAFYDKKSDAILQPSEILGAPILFKTSVTDYAFKSGGWRVIGSAQLEANLAEPVKFFMQDAYSGSFSIYRDDGSIVPATRSEIEGLEAAAVWDPEHVQDRLRDYYLGVANVWLEALKLK